MHPQGSAVDGFEAVEHDEQHQHVRQRSTQRSEEAVDVGGLHGDDAEGDQDCSDDRHLHQQRSPTGSPGDPQRHDGAQCNGHEDDRVLRCRTVERTDQHAHACECRGRCGPPGDAGDRCVGFERRRAQADLALQDPHTPPRWSGVVTVSLGVCLRGDRRPSSRSIVVGHWMQDPVRGAHDNGMAESAPFVECPAQSVGIGGGRNEVDHPALVGGGQAVVHDQLVSAQRRCPVNRTRRVARPPGAYPVDLAVVVAALRGHRTISGALVRLHFDQRSVTDRRNVHVVDRDGGRSSPPEQTCRPSDLDAHRELRDHAGCRKAHGRDEHVHFSRCHGVI